MALFAVLAVAVVWATIVVRRARTTLRERRTRRHWQGAMSTLSGLSNAPAEAAGEAWCRTLPRPRTPEDAATPRVVGRAKT